MQYLDTSAFLKLVVDEPESRALRAVLDPSRLVTSALLVVESRRAATRYGAVAEARARGALAGITLLPLDRGTLEQAAVVRPPLLRSLDAVHLATALSLGDGLESVLCYDARFADAATAHGLRVSAPG